MTLWTPSPGQYARTVSAWGKIGDTDEQVQIVVARVSSDRMALLETYRREVLGAMTEVENIPGDETTFRLVFPASLQQAS